MFDYIGGKVVEIQGLQCNLPPVGKVFNKFTNKLEDTTIYSRSDKKKEQYWELPPRPRNSKRRLIEEHRQRELVPNFFESELQAYREQEWKRRMNGFWFYNNGEPTFITGLHYFYLVHWRIDIGAPKFRTTDLEYFYFLDYVNNDPDCFGMVEVTQRRNGKSFRAGCWIYEVGSRAKRARCGIQSKDLEAAETFFDVHVVQPYVELEYIFKPVVDLEKGLAPKKVMRFFMTTKRGEKGTKSQEDNSTKELKSRIDYQSSNEKAYDGKKLKAYVRDECGKTIESNVYICHGVIKPCLSDGELIIGKSLYTTTVEDIKDDDLYGTDGNFKKLWDESDQLTKGKNGRTISGLYRYFLPAYRADKFNKYGIPDEEKTRLFQQNERDNLSGSALAAYIRRYPFTIEEAFWTSKEDGILDKVAIQNQISEVIQLEQSDLFDIGNLHWENGKIGDKIIWSKTTAGKFKFVKEFKIAEEVNRINSEKDVYGLWQPKNKATRCIGVDPVDHKSQNKPGYKSSNAAAYLYMKYSPLDPLSETFVCEYLNRPKHPELFYEDMGLLAFATGAELIVENNKPGIFTYLDKAELKDMYYHNGSTDGIPASEKNKQLMADCWEMYVGQNIKKIKYIKLLEDLSSFNLIKSTKFDAAMAAGWGLVGSYGEKVSIQNVTESEYEVIESSDFY